MTWDLILTSEEELAGKNGSVWRKMGSSGEKTTCDHVRCACVCVCERERDRVTEIGERC